MPSTSRLGVLVIRSCSPPPLAFPAVASGQGHVPLPERSTTLLGQPAPWSWDADEAVSDANTVRSRRIRSPNPLPRITGCGWRPVFEMRWGYPRRTGLGFRRGCRFYRRDRSSYEHAVTWQRFVANRVVMIQETVMGQPSAPGRFSQKQSGRPSTESGVKGRPSGRKKAGRNIAGSMVMGRDISGHEPRPFGRRVRSAYLLKSYYYFFATTIEAT